MARARSALRRDCTLRLASPRSCGADEAEVAKTRARREPSRDAEGRGATEAWHGEPTGTFGGAVSLGSVSEDERPREARATLMPLADEHKIPKGRVRRSAKLGAAIGGQATRYAGTEAANLARSEEAPRSGLETRHVETALKMVSVARRDEGRGDEDRPDRLLHRHRLPAARVPRDLPGAAREAAHLGAADAVGEGRARCWRRSTTASRSESSSPRSSPRRSPPPRSARSTARRCTTAAPVAVKIQYPGRRRGARVRPGQRRHPRAAGQGAGARASTRRRSPSELRERVLEELDYEYEAQNQRSLRPRLRRPPVHLRARGPHRGSRAGGCWSPSTSRATTSRRSSSSPQDERDLFGEIVFRFCFGSIYHLQHFNADTHPGNYILMDDGRVAFLDFGMTKRLDREQILLEQRAVDAASRKDPERAARGAARPRLRQEPARSSTPSG